MAADEPLDIFEGQDVSRSTTSNRLGSYIVQVALLHAVPPVQHVFFARGQRSGRMSLKAGVTL